MRMKYEKLVKFGVPKTKIKDYVKQKGSNVIPSQKNSLMESTSTPTKGFTIIVDDLGLVMDAWHRTLSEFDVRMRALAHCTPQTP